MSLSAQQPIFVGIAGGSGSGKTTVARKIQEAFGDEAVLIEQDSYYRDFSALTSEERANINFDHPRSLEFDLLRYHLEQLRENRSIEKPIYNFCTHLREQQTVRVEPRPVVIVEGILLLAVPEIRELLDLKIYVDNQDDIRLLRRLERDIKERGRDVESVREQYIKTVKPMHAAFVEPSKWFADLIIPTVHDNGVAVSSLLSTLKASMVTD
jgi:uridine kinase